MATQREQSIVDVIINGDVANATMKDLQKAARQLTAEFRNAADPAQKAQIAQQFQKINGQIKEQNELLKGTGGTFGKLTDQFKAFGAAAGIYFGAQAIKEFFSSSLAAYNSQIQAEAKLLNALGGRTNVQKELIRQSEELQKSVNIPDEVILQQQAFLAAQGRTTEQIKKTIEAAIQFSAVTGEDLDSSVKKLDGTYEGVIGKMGKMDSNFKDLTEEQLKNGAAVDIIINKYKGFAETAAQTGLGPLKQLGLVIDDLKEKVGGFLASFILPFVKGMSSLVTAINEWAGASKQAVQISADSIRANQQQAASAQGLLTRYNELTKEGLIPTTEQKKELDRITLQLKDTLGESVVSIDAETGALVLNKEAVKEAIKQKLLLANQEASSLALRANKFQEDSDAAKEQIQQLKNEKDTRVAIAKETGLSEADLIAAIQARKQAEKTQFGGASGKQLTLEQSEAVTAYSKTIAALTNESEKSAEAEKERAEILRQLNELGFSAKDIETLFSGALKETSQAADGAAQSLKQMKDEVERLKTAQEKETPGSEKFIELGNQIDALNQKITNSSGKQTEAQKKYAENTKKLLAELAEVGAAAIKDEEQREQAALAAKFANRKKEITETVADAKVKSELLKAEEEKFQTERDEIAKKFMEKRTEDEFTQSKANLTDYNLKVQLADAERLASGEINQQQYNDLEKQHEQEFLDAMLVIYQDYNKAETAEGLRAAIKQAQDRIAALKEGRSKEQADIIAAEELRVANSIRGSQAEYDALVALAEAKYQEDLLNFQGTEAEKEVFKAQHLRSVEDMEADHLNNLISLYEAGFNQIMGIVRAANSAANYEEDNKLKKEQKRDTQRKADLKKLLDEKRISQEEYDKQIAGIDAAAEKREKESKLRQWKAEHSMALAQAAISTAVAIGKALAGGPPPFNLVLAAISAAAEAAQLAIIAGQSPPEFKKGTILDGPSHTEGGMPIVDPRSGKKVAEVEGGELLLSKMFVDKNPSLAQILLNASQNNDGALPQINFQRINETRTIDKFTRGTFIQPTPSEARAGVNQAPPDLTPDQKAEGATNNGEMKYLMERNAAALEQIAELLENGIEAKLDYVSFKKDGKRLDSINSSSGLQ